MSDEFFEMGLAQCESQDKSLLLLVANGGADMRLDWDIDYSRHHEYEYRDVDDIYIFRDKSWSNLISFLLFHQVRPPCPAVRVRLLSKHSLSLIH